MENIPSKFNLFATEIEVVFDNEHMNDQKCYGLFEHSRSRITLSTTDGVNRLSKDRIIETFYHERTHAILEAMREYELSANEKFVDLFSKLLRQADESAHEPHEPKETLAEELKKWHFKPAPHSEEEILFFAKDHVYSTHSKVYTADNWHKAPDGVYAFYDVYGSLQAIEGRGFLGLGSHDKAIRIADLPPEKI